jgi:hypothetical protein
MTEPPVPARRSQPPLPSPDARERVVDALTRLYADDRISEAELEARLERVYHATSAAELEAILADLPASVPTTASHPTRTDIRPAHRISATFSSQEQRLSGIVPRRLELRGRLGYVELDLTGATFEAGLTEIDVRAFMGYVQIRFPAGVRVESHGRALFGFFALKGSTAAGADAASIVRVTGRATFGFAECWVGGGRKALPHGGEAAGADRTLED